MQGRKHDKSNTDTNVRARDLEVVAIKLEPKLVKSSDATNDEVINTNVQKKLMW